MSGIRTTKNAGDVHNQLFVKKWHAVAFGVAAVVILGIHLWYSQASVTLKHVSQLPHTELRAVYYTIGPNVFPIESKHWHSLVEELPHLQVASDTGGDRKPWGSMMCFELDWGTDRRYWVRLRTREGLGDRIIATLEEPWGDAGSFHHKGYYNGTPLWNWFNATKPRVRGFAHRSGGPGCLPIRGARRSHLLPSSW